MKVLKEYQIKALDFLKNHKKAMLAMDMGLGKTFTTVNWLKDKPTPALILVQKTKINDWKKEIELCGLDINNYTIISYQKYTYDKRKEPTKYNDHKTLVVDESQVLKNHKTKISKQTLSFSNTIDYVLLLTGDPLSTGYENLFTQMRIINALANDVNYYMFERMFCKVMKTSHNFSMIIGYYNIDQLLELLHKKAFFLKSEEVLDLEERTIIDVDVPLSEEYKYMEKNRFLQIDDIVVEPELSLVRMNKLRQLCSDFVYNDEQTFDIGTNKQDRFKELIDNKENFVVFYNYEKELEIIRTICKNQKRTLVEINGNKNNFNPNKEYHNTIVAIHYQSGAKGIDGLQHCFNKTIYYSPTLSGELYKQSLKRTHRLGQKKPCFYWRLIGEKSIEQKIYKQLNNYQDYTLTLFEKEI